MGGGGAVGVAFGGYDYSFIFPERGGLALESVHAAQGGRDIFDFHAADLAVVLGVECVGQAKDGGQADDGFLLLGKQVAESFVAARGQNAAMEAGFSSFELGATLTGERLFRVRGYTPINRIEVPLANGASLPVIRMSKSGSMRTADPVA